MAAVLRLRHRGGKWLERDITNNLADAQARDLLSDEDVVRIAEVASSTCRAEAALDGSHLLHGDFLLRHLFVNEWGELSGIIDFSALGGDPLMDAAIVSLWEDALLEPMLEGHGGLDTNVPRWFLYRLWRGLGEAVFMDKLGLDISGQISQVRTARVALT